MFDPFLWYIVPGYCSNSPRGEFACTLYCTLYKFSLAILDAGSPEGSGRTQGFYPRRSRVKPLPSSQTSVAGRPSVALVDAPRAVKRQLPKGWGSLRHWLPRPPAWSPLRFRVPMFGHPRSIGKVMVSGPCKTAPCCRSPESPPRELPLLGASERWKPAQPRPEIQPGTFWLKTRRDRVCCCASSLVFRVLNREPSGSRYLQNQSKAGRMNNASTNVQAKKRAARFLGEGNRPQVENACTRGP